MTRPWQFPLALLALPVVLTAQDPLQISNVAYGSWVDGQGRSHDLLLDLYLPAVAVGPRPLIVWIHGGGWEMGSRALAPQHATTLTNRGYAVASIDYRLSGEAPWPAQIHDCKAAVRFLRANAATWQLDGDRIGAFGDSAGAHLATALGTMGGIGSTQIGSVAIDLEGTGGNHADTSSRVQAVCDWYGPTTMLHAHDFPTTDYDAPSSFVSRLLGGPLQQLAAQWTTADPISFLSADDAPLLIQHGADDAIVPLHQSELLYAAATTNGLLVTFTPIANNGHGGPGFVDPLNLQRVHAFFDRTLRDLPTTRVAIEATDASAVEDRQDPAVFTLSRTGQLQTPLAVRLWPAGHATQGIDCAPLPLLATIPAGIASIQIVLVPFDDALVEGNESVTLAIAPSPAYRIDSTRAAAAAVLVDNDSPAGLPVVSVLVSDADAAEPFGNPGQFRFVRSGPTMPPLTVAYDLTGTAQRNSDFTGPIGTVTFAEGATQVLMPVTILDDALPEAGETVIVKVRAGPHHALGQAVSAHMVIADDDRSARPIVNVVAIDPNAGEPADAAAFQLTRTGSTAAALVVRVAFQGSARPGVDYLQASTQVTIPAGQTGTRIALPVLDDSEAEGPEDIQLRVLPQSTYSLGVQPSQQIWLADDEDGPWTTPVQLAITPLVPGVPAFASIAGGSPGGIALLAVSTAPGLLPLAPLGTVRLDPSAVVLVGIALLDARGDGRVPIPVPTDIPLVPAWIVFQALCAIPAAPFAAFSNVLPRRIDLPPVR